MLNNRKSALFSALLLLCLLARSFFYFEAYRAGEIPKVYLMDRFAFHAFLFLSYSLAIAYWSWWKAEKLSTDPEKKKSWLTLKRDYRAISMLSGFFLIIFLILKNKYIGT
jgi:hypothetical protein